MNYSWGPVTNKYNAFVNKCTVLRPNVNCRVCPHFSHDGFTYAEDILRGYFELQNFEARQDDIYLISFPKTGDTF